MADWREAVVQPSWGSREDVVLLITRLSVGAFLIWGVWDNIESPARMAEFARFLQRHEFPMPHFAAPLSVVAQFACGIAFILGFATRWAGLICAINFAVALYMVDSKLGIRGAFPAMALMLFGMIFATVGAGRIAIDAMLSREDR